jgi:hypothetical protein
MRIALTRPPSPPPEPAVLHVHAAGRLLAVARQSPVDPRHALPILLTLTMANTRLMVYSLLWRLTWRHARTRVCG